MNRKCKTALKIAGVAAAILIVCYLSAFLLNCTFANGFRFRWDSDLFFERRTGTFFGLLAGVTALIFLLYYYKHYWLKATNRIIRGHRRDNGVETNLEQARFQSETDIRKNFKHSSFENLAAKDVVGIPIRAVQRQKSYDIDFAPPAHTLVIGTTGSGKTTTFINPTVQILAESKAKPSMLISDPKGELYRLHAGSLKKCGYTVKVLDLRAPFHSTRWNPLERPYINYQKMLRVGDEPVANEEHGSYLFDGKEYHDINKLNGAIAVKKQQLFDLVYEDLHDVASVLCPVTNKQEPIWESGAKYLCLAVMIAMLEDSENDELNMTKDKYVFYNIKATATNTEGDCAELSRYFQGRAPTSRSVSLARQVLDSADKTRGSYLSTLFDKLNLFADIALCGLTSANEIDFAEMADKPTTVFLQIPDERETRHPLAAMVILQAYKELVRKANSYESLSLPRHVFFLLDEFGNLPAVHRLEQMITVGRSRNIWLCMVIQSYAQLAKVYDEKVAEIIKSNCNIQAFIGSTDQKTIEDFSKRCGNYSVITRNVGYSTVKADDINSNASIKERPLIYPSELQRLNAPGNFGNTIVTVFGYQPIRSRFTPSFLCKSLNMQNTEPKKRCGRFFDEERIFYDMKKRNALVVPTPPPEIKGAGGAGSGKQFERKIRLVTDDALAVVTELFDDGEKRRLLKCFERKHLEEAQKMLAEAHRRALAMKYDDAAGDVERVQDGVCEIMRRVAERELYRR
jgi:type IV secretion system protein VirD4